jgi:transcriptional regulator with XRE-family HTH domain
MPDILASCNTLFARVTGTRSDIDSGMLRRMPKKPPSQLQVAITARLRAVQAELGRTDEQMATLAKRGRTTWTNWVNEENMPTEQAMVDLCEAASLSMDWLYRGVAASMPSRLVIRLELRLAGIDPDNATPEQVAPIAAKVAASALVSV